MHTLNQWLEGKKKEANYQLGGGYEKDESYNKALADLQKDLPILLSTMEAEIRGKIGEPKPFIKNGNDDATIEYNKMITVRNQERSRIHEIIHEYFN